MNYKKGTTVALILLIIILVLKLVLGFVKEIL
jgi:hypothetical protein